MQSAIMNRRRFLQGLGALSAAACTVNPLRALAQAATQTRPNIVFFFVDDMGWQDTSEPFWTERTPFNDRYRTPNMARLARSGVKFTQAYAAAPVCAPTRAALMTGKTPARLHLTAVFDRDRGEMPLLPPAWHNELPHREWTLAERLKAQGYLTAQLRLWQMEIQVMDNVLRGFVTGNVRHAQVHVNQVDSLVLYACQSFFSAGSLKGLMPQLFEISHEDGAVYRGIIHDKDVQAGAGIRDAVA